MAATATRPFSGEWLAGLPWPNVVPDRYDLCEESRVVDRDGPSAGPASHTRYWLDDELVAWCAGPAPPGSRDHVVVEWPDDRAEWAYWAHGGVPLGSRVTAAPGADPWEDALHRVLSQLCVDTVPLPGVELCAGLLVDGLALDPTVAFPYLVRIREGQVSVDRPADEMPELDVWVGGPAATLVRWLSGRCLFRDIAEGVAAGGNLLLLGVVAAAFGLRTAAADPGLSHRVDVLESLVQDHRVVADVLRERGVLAAGGSP